MNVISFVISLGTQKFLFFLQKILVIYLASWNSTSE